MGAAEGRQQAGAAAGNEVTLPNNPSKLLLCLYRVELFPRAMDALYSAPPSLSVVQTARALFCVAI